MREMSCYNCVRANEINECEACIKCWRFSNYEPKRVRYVVYHYECVPEEYVMDFSTVEEACVFRDKYDFEDEWLIGEIIED